MPDSPIVAKRPSSKVDKKPAAADATVVVKKPAAADNVFKKPAGAIVVKKKVVKTKVAKEAAKKVAEDKKKKKGADTKKGLATIVVAAAGKRPRPAYVPVHYKGGRIYWSKSKKAWRVYLRAEDKIEVNVPLGDDPDDAHIEKQWRKALKAIERDGRPIK